MYSLNSLHFSRVNARSGVGDGDTVSLPVRSRLDLEPLRLRRRRSVVCSHLSFLLFLLCCALFDVVLECVPSKGSARVEECGGASLIVEHTVGPSATVSHESAPSPESQESPAHTPRNPPISPARGSCVHPAPPLHAPSSRLVILFSVHRPPPPAHPLQCAQASTAGSKGHAAAHALLPAELMFRSMFCPPEGR